MWAIFQDNDGVLHCEEVNLGIECWVTYVEYRPQRRNLFGKIIQHERPAEKKMQTVFLRSHYRHEDYMAEAFEKADAGFVFDENLRYMKRNLWGPVRVLKFVEDDIKAKRLHTELVKFAPDFKRGEVLRPENATLLNILGAYNGY